MSWSNGRKVHGPMGSSNHDASTRDAQRISSNTAIQIREELGISRAVERRWSSWMMQKDSCCPRQFQACNHLDSGRRVIQCQVYEDPGGSHSDQSSQFNPAQVGLPTQLAKVNLVSPIWNSKSGFLCLKIAVKIIIPGHSSSGPTAIAHFRNRGFAKGVDLGVAISAESFAVKLKWSRSDKRVARTNHEHGTNSLYPTRASTRKHPRHVRKDISSTISAGAVIRPVKKDRRSNRIPKDTKARQVDHLRPVAKSWFGKGEALGSGKKSVMSQDMAGVRYTVELPEGIGIGELGCATVLCGAKMSRI
ncbi:hypothetical protein FA13DRAFT_1778183 [Coprinellus micaceus]|uniref:Uncharacterized protein n=1 Tax=Coprinellus micaceus TaxID=71717 RepID=A0A4Y7SP48_COPMI|nr:hypothetical protein FA13DRAFT_1778183 [Coprinellus micaceus]